MTENYRNSLLDYGKPPKKQGGVVDLILDKDEVESLYAEGELMAVGEDKEVVFIKVRTHCTTCEDSGALLTWNTKTNRHEVQKCDECGRFGTDYLAWMSVEPIPSIDEIDDYTEDLDMHLKEDVDRDWL